MIIQGMGHQYEVIRKLESGAAGVHYICREMQDLTAGLWNLQQVSDKSLITQLIPRVLELEELGDGSDWREYILNQEGMYLVFPYKNGRFLDEYLKSCDISLEKRYLTGRLLLERLLISTMPVWMKWEVCQAGRILLSDEEQVTFYHGLEHVSDYGEVTEGMIWKRLGEVFNLLFSEDCSIELYPELQHFLEECEAGAWQTLMEGFKAYLDLMPAAMEDRKGIRAAEELEKEEKAKKEKEDRKNPEMRKKAVCSVLKLSAVVLICAAAYKVGPFLWKQVIFPQIEARYLVKTMALSDPAAAGYSGKTELIYDDTGKTAWRGVLEDGFKTGYGTSYYEDGMIEYEGNFENGRRSGAGILYDDRGNLCYEGEFSFDRYEGRGCLYEDGALVYEGGFFKGQYDGEGTCYKDGLAVACGNFKNGILTDGTGLLLDKNGRVSYEGEMKSGIPSGRGTAYENGERIYEGMFEAGKFQGTGKLYSPNAGGMMYEGDFEEGVYSGEGKQYEPNTGYLLYEGNFRLGQYDGEGTEYDSFGCLRYKGKFCLGVYQGYGAMYDTNTGKVMLEGEFRNGYLATPKEELFPEETGEEGGQDIEETAEEETAEKEIAEEETAEKETTDRETTETEAQGDAEEDGTPAGGETKDGSDGEEKRSGTEDILRSAEEDTARRDQEIGPGIGLGG